MRYRIILIALLSALLTWSMEINRQSNRLIDETKVLINEQSKTIEKYQYEVIELSNEIDRLKVLNDKCSEEKQESLNNADIELLARLINAEAGSDWCEHEMKRLVGIVALNRLQSEQFPNTLEEVIYEKGQYACVIDGNINKEPTEECIEIAEDLLINGYNEPKYIIYQAEFEQGTQTYKVVQNMYFCG